MNTPDVPYADIGIRQQQIVQGGGPALGAGRAVVHLAVDGLAAAAGGFAVPAPPDHRAVHAVTYIVTTFAVLDLVAAAAELPVGT
jgi:hypothetical protein